MTTPTLAEDYALLLPRLGDPADLPAEDRSRITRIWRALEQADAARGDPDDRAVKFWRAGASFIDIGCLPGIGRMHIEQQDPACRDPEPSTPHQPDSAAVNAATSCSAPDTPTARGEAAAGAADPSTSTGASAAGASAPAPSDMPREEDGALATERATVFGILDRASQRASDSGAPLPDPKDALLTLVRLMTMASVTSIHNILAIRSLTACIERDRHVRALDAWAKPPGIEGITSSREWSTMSLMGKISVHMTSLDRGSSHDDSFDGEDAPAARALAAVKLLPEPTT